MGARVFIERMDRGDWKVYSEKTTRSASAHLTKEAALARAKEIARNKGGGTVVIREKGRIVKNISVK